MLARDAQQLIYDLFHQYLCTHLIFALPHLQQYPG